jgi:hypothetical protein
MQIVEISLSQDETFVRKHKLKFIVILALTAIIAILIRISFSAVDSSSRKDVLLTSSILENDQQHNNNNNSIQNSDFYWPEEQIRKGNPSLSLHGVRYLLDRIDKGAKCLDGTSALANVFRGAEPRAKAIVFFQEGGGWCTSMFSCFWRAATHWGTGNAFHHPPIVKPFSGPTFLSRDCAENPIFCNFDLVHLRYCDGNMHSSDVQHPVEVPEAIRKDRLDANFTKLYFRGKRIREAALDFTAKYAIREGITEIMYSGESAGGWSALLNADRDFTRLLKHHPRITKIVAVPADTLFPVDLQTVSGDKTRPLLMAIRATIQVSKNTILEQVSQKCVDDLKNKFKNDRTSMNFSSNNNFNFDPTLPDDHELNVRFKCLFPKFLLNYSNVPTFFLGSLSDEFVGNNIAIGHASPDYSFFIRRSSALFALGQPICGIGRRPFRYCSQDQMNPFLNLQNEVFEGIVRNAKALRRKGNGAILISCFRHVGLLSREFRGTRVDGISSSDALWKWWNEMVPKNNVEEVNRRLNNAVHEDYYNNIYQNPSNNIDCLRNSNRSLNAFPENWECNPSCNPR